MMIGVESPDLFKDNVVEVSPLARNVKIPILDLNDLGFSQMIPDKFDPNVVNNVE